METLVTILTVIALVMVNSLVLMYQPRTIAGKVFYGLLLIPVFILIFIAVLLTLQL